MPISVGAFHAIYPGMTLAQRAGGGGVAPIVSQTFSAMSVSTDGWTLNATVTASKIGGTYANLNNVTTPGLSLVVRSTSWTTGGVQTTVDRTVYATAVKRKPYNQQAVREETTSGSDFTTIYTLSSKVYQSDTIVSCTVAAGFFTDNGSGGSGAANLAQTPTVTNSSTLVYPAPIAMWLNHDRDRATSSSYSVGLTVAHRFFRNGQTVRAVKFIATDQHSNTASVIATAMTKIDFTGSGLSASEFRGSIDISGLTQGDLLTIDCIIYPWVGSAWQASVDGATYPSPNMTTLQVLCDRTGAYGTVYAYVDGVGGAPAVSANPVTAATTPYSTVALAAAAIKSFNNTNFGRNNCAGGIIRLTATTHTHSTFSASGGGPIPLVIEAADVANKSTTIYRDAGSSTSGSIPAYLKFKDITLQKNGAGSIIFVSSGATSTSASALIIQNCNFDVNSTTDYNGWIASVGQMTLINCTGNMPLATAQALAGTPKQVNSWGCDTVGVGNAVYNMCGNKSLSTVWSAGAVLSQFQAPAGVICGFSFLGNANSGGISIDRDNVNLAIMGNVFEQRTGNAQPVLNINASGTHTTTQLLDIANTGIGSRINYIYNDGTSASLIAGDGISALSVWENPNTKGDVFATNAVCIGNWSFRYRVDSIYRVALTGTQNQLSPSATSWLGEIAAKGDASGLVGTPINPAWTNDQSFFASGSGNGDYRPVAASTALPQVTAAIIPFPYDQKGKAVPVDGTAYVGALQAA